MAWAALEVDVPRWRADAASALLFTLGASGVQEDFRPGEAPPPRQPWDADPAPTPPAILRLRAWFEDPDRRSVEAALADHGMRPVRWEDVPDVDWSSRWQEGFAPVRISDRLVVAQPWNAPPGALVVEPGHGFGTGLHATTRAALEELDRVAEHHRDALDVGCGSGVLAVAAAKLGLTARGIDVDPEAVAHARSTARRNGLLVDFSTTPLDQVEPPADLVLANLHAEVLVDLAPAIARCTRREAVLAGILRDREDLVRRAFAPHLELAARRVGPEWVLLRYARSPR